MENKPSIDPGLLAPIVLGGLSVLGILYIFFGGAFRARPAGEPVATSTPFRYVYLGTEPGLSTLTPQPTATRFLIATTSSTATSDADSDEPSFPTSAITQPVFPTQPAVRTPTPTVTETVPAALNVFDDTFNQILYEGEWTSQTNVTDAHQNTLHISFTVGNYAQFTFVGEQIIVTYQAGPSLGQMLITIDGLEYPAVSQSNGTTLSVNWPSPVLRMGSHDIVIEHLSGGSINIDKFTIPDLRTPTPTVTP